MVSAVEAKNAGTTSVQQFDSDHQVLLNVQGELADTLARELPAEHDAAGFDKDGLRALLDRVEDAIADNRSKRASAFLAELD